MWRPRECSWCRLDYHRGTRRLPRLSAWDTRSSGHRGALLRDDARHTLAWDWADNRRAWSGSEPVRPPASPSPLPSVGWWNCVRTGTFRWRKGWTWPEHRPAAPEPPTISELAELELRISTLNKSKLKKVIKNLASLIKTGWENG